MTPQALDLGHLSLRQRERGFLGGGTQVGKSTLADALREDFLARYAPLKARCLILDTKPRYRAQWEPNGTSTKQRYRNWEHGPSVPDSVVVHTVAQMRQAFANGHRTVIAQADSSAEIPNLVAITDAFLRDSKRGRPQLLQVDETCDFFHGNGMPIGGDALIRCARAGAERGTACLFCSQRTKGISGHLLEHMERLYAFRLDNASDAKRYSEFGAPAFALPRKKYLFKYWTKEDYETIYGPYQLEPPRVGARA